MERKFFINWQVLIEEAKQRRKQQKLTQQQLATFAKVSTPTVSRFENGAKDIQLSSVLNILGILGMVDQHRLDFPTSTAKYIFDRDVIRFIGQDGSKQVTCEISREALEDHFNGDMQSPMKAFAKNRLAIEHEARRKYLDSQMNAEGIVTIKTDDL